ncbi:hypothetical protein [Streptomyces sp. RK76]|uniref:hypothetical protein n=1 Tax=Streptomyces sp. RK76 TaxID=2824896 RepID=UPI001B3984C5|nr:hypothetical protein [Streptomyces sp. RK76]MBQ0949207.1 hypothetical protein [Streptomyces sp. RK76]
MNEVTNPELGEKLGLAPGDTVEMVSDEWDFVAPKGERGKITHFHLDGGMIFAYVLFGDAHFPFTSDEIQKVVEVERP